MDLILSNFPYAQAYIDDVITCGRDVKQCYERTYKVLDKFRQKEKSKGYEISIFLETIWDMQLRQNHTNLTPNTRKPFRNALRLQTFMRLKLP